ncbi:murein DD-endopeptidase MepM/ murein hydrolase activator NlpD [Microbacterium resistens]|uniref:Murein DD-endopeptidase MepM/ murein hydrolase activator NlpD n=1 Tax=Microbacterium resistens TaxID=156977 RepID=A0ABU1S8R5_9MICO|nr:M23 family metallopeptidase [Microbacterium resistens]MDR6865999.1 murein DD-endopeptidase MepM/ murein hydrolase activator NlpD [Microbacterium resistens]
MTARPALRPTRRIPMLAAAILSTALSVLLVASPIMSPPSFGSVLPPGSTAHAVSADDDRAGPRTSSGDWAWPFAGARRIVAPYRAPAHAYGPGHRGMDIAGSGEVRSPADGVVAFRGVVVDRPLITIDHGGGLVTTYEALESTLTPGTAVRRGEGVGIVGTGGHAPPGTLHVGVRRDGAYVDPLPLFGKAPRAILLPCGGTTC